MPVDLTPWLQKQPDNLEGIPDRVEKDKDVLALKQTAIRWLPKLVDGPICSIGPAMGWEVMELQKRYPDRRVVGVSLFREECESMRSRGLEAFEADMHALPREWTDTAALVYANSVCEHSPAPHVMLCEFARVLAPGGHLCVVMPEAAGVLHPGNIERFKRMDSLATHVYLPEPMTFIAALRKAKLEFVMFKTIAQNQGGLLCAWHYWYLARKNA